MYAGSQPSDLWVDFVLGGFMNRDAQTEKPPPVVFTNFMSTQHSRYLREVNERSCYGGNDPHCLIAHYAVLEWLKIESEINRHGDSSPR